MSDQVYTGASGLNFQCPVCSVNLADVRHCRNCGTEFSTCDGLPVLIDFKESIFQEHEYHTSRAPPSPHRGSGLSRLVRRLTFGSNQIAPLNIKAFMEGLKGPKVLVIGGGTIGAGIEALYERNDLQVTGIDVYPSRHIQLICDAHSLPFRDKSFDGVVIQAVLEHVIDPQRVVSEISRILTPSAMLYAETPFMQQVHEGAYDFTRFTCNGHRWLFRHFSEISSGYVQGPGVALLWSISYFVRSLTRSKKAAAVVTALFFWIRYLDRFVERGAALDSAGGVYFLGRKSEGAIQLRDVPDYYLQLRKNAA